MSTIINMSGTKDALGTSLIVVSVVAMLAAVAFGVYMFQTLGVSDTSGTDKSKVEVVLPKIGDPEPKTQN